jgi:hypothetical protein
VLRLEGGPDELALASSIGQRERASRFVLEAGERAVFVLGCGGSPPVLDEVPSLLESTIRFWKSWCGSCVYSGPYADHVERSAITLKLLSYAPSGAIVAAPTTSLPEEIGGERNWDYRPRSSTGGTARVETATAMRSASSRLRYGAARRPRIVVPWSFLRVRSQGRSRTHDPLIGAAGHWGGDSRVGVSERAATPSRRRHDSRDVRTGTHTTDAKPSAEALKVVDWRRSQLVAAGFGTALADVLAVSSIDLHALIELVERGCPPELAARILAPLDAEEDHD